MLPLVSKRWAQLLQWPSAAWDSIHIDTSDDELFAEGSSMLNVWFSACGASVRELRILCSESLRMLPYDATASILRSQAASLRVLELGVSTVHLSGTDMRLLLLNLHSLESLTIQFDNDCAAGWENHSAALMVTVSQLPALVKVEILRKRTTPGWKSFPPSLSWRECRAPRSATWTGIWRALPAASSSAPCRRCANAT